MHTSSMESAVLIALQLRHSSIAMNTIRRYRHIMSKKKVSVAYRSVLRKVQYIKWMEEGEK